MENYHTYLFQVGAGFSGMALKDYLFTRGFSTNLVRKIKTGGKVWVNGEEYFLYEKIKTGDSLVIDLGKEPLEPEPEFIPLDIIYEDHDLLVVNKGPFLVTHPVRRYPHGTLANAAAFYFSQKGIEAKVRFINRLDRNTSGIIMISKNIYAHEFIQKQLKERTVKKTYWALVKGVLRPKAGIVDAPIGRVSKASIARSILPTGQAAVTGYKVLEEFQDLSLVQLIPQTGRTHQLRVHLAYLGHPIIGDELYNSDDAMTLSRQALHAREIEFIHPRSRKRIKLTAQLSPDMAALISEGKK